MNKSGYISVFLILILIPSIIGLSLMVGVSKYYQFEANLNGKIKLIANSILSRYDKKLFDRYGILTTKEEFLNNEDKFSYINLINDDFFEIEEFNISYSESLFNINNLSDAIVKYQANRFVYNSTKELMAAIINQQDNNKEEILNDFNSIAEIYAEILKDYESLNEFLIKFREEYNNLYKKLAKDINKKEIYIVNLINDIRNLSKQEETELEKESKIDSIINSAKYITKEVESVINQYGKYSEILNDILIEINTIESKVSRIYQLSEQFYELELNFENDTLHSMISDSKNFNNLINDNKLKNKVKINFQKSKDIANDLKGLGLSVKVNSAKQSIDYNQLKRIDLKWINNFSSDLNVLNYIKLESTDFHSLDIHQNQIEDVLGNDKNFENLVSTIKKVFNTKNVEINNKKLKASTVKKLYSNNFKSQSNKETVLNKAFSKLVIIDYINEIFNCYISVNGVNNSYFEKSEIEYILNGKYNNEENIKATKRKLIALRTVFNLEYILKNSEMMNFISEITLGFSSIHPMLTPVIKIVLISTIAVTEANVDYYKLVDSIKVPLIKDRESWNLGVSSLKEIIEGNFNLENLDSEKGLSYENYLSILMFINKKETTTKRIGDIIQLNSLIETNEILDLVKLYQGVNVKISGKYNMINKFNPLKINIVEEGDYQY